MPPPSELCQTVGVEGMERYRRLGSAVIFPLALIAVRWPDLGGARGEERLT
jgi:hypothetical protein